MTRRMKLATQSGKLPVESLYAMNWGSERYGNEIITFNKASSSLWVSFGPVSVEEISSSSSEKEGKGAVLPGGYNGVSDPSEEVSL